MRSGCIVSREDVNHLNSKRPMRSGWGVCWQLVAKKLFETTYAVGMGAGFEYIASLKFETTYAVGMDDR